MSANSAQVIVPFRQLQKLSQHISNKIESFLVKHPKKEYSFEDFWNGIKITEKEKDTITTIASNFSLAVQTQNNSYREKPTSLTSLPEQQSELPVYPKDQE